MDSGLRFPIEGAANPLFRPFLAHQEYYPITSGTGYTLNVVKLMVCNGTDFLTLSRTVFNVFYFRVFLQQAV